MFPQERSLIEYGLTDVTLEQILRVQMSLLVLVEDFDSFEISVTLITFERSVAGVGCQVQLQR